jgi:hypothetical protein
MSATWVDYRNGINHPQFTAVCGRCGTRHGPYAKFALIPYLCALCNDADYEMSQQHMETKENERVPTQNPR